MASKSSRAKASAGAGKGKAGRRGAVRPRSGSGVPLLPIVVGGILGVLAIAMVALIVYYQRPNTTSNPTVSGIKCDQLEHSTVHYHAALQIVYDGQVRNLPGDAAIQKDANGGTKCFYWLHIHAQDPNIIHIESPGSQVFSLGQFFDVLNAWSKANGKPEQKLDSTHVSTFTLSPDQQMKVYIDLGDGKGAQLYDGDPRTIQLKSHEVITIEITPPDVSPPPACTFPSGL